MSELNQLPSPEGCRLLFDQMDDFVYIIERADSIYQCYFANEKANRWFGEPLRGKTVEEVFPNERERRIEKLFDHVFTTQKAHTYEGSCFHYHAAEISLSPVIVEGKCLYIVAIIRNLSPQQRLEKDGDEETIYSIPAERKRIPVNTSLQPDSMENQDDDSEVQRQAELYRLITENTHDLIMITNREGEISYASSSHEKLLEYNVTQMIGRNWNEFIMSTFRDGWNQYVLNVINHEEDSLFECLLSTSTLNEIWIEMKANLIYNQQGTIESIVYVSREITDRKKLEQELKFMAYHDSLTKLPNRRYVKSVFEDMKENVDNANASMALCYIDGDNFKKVNDRYGHDVGDEFIRLFGQTIKQSIRTADILARLGGDEFLLVLPNLQQEKDILQVIKRIQKYLSEGFKIAGQPFFPTSSIGVCIYPNDGTDLDTLMVQADKALYRAKSLGKNQVEFYKEIANYGFGI
ncbi:sensor domain-containing diguanylate cyclase [Bacillus spongiae]|uniref:Sensor domain-containing diguanylate cyclase n=1 Tax=Bacillus spongiae TaxID=2683610 RepID=A0ABU8HHG9_9BACI